MKVLSSSNQTSKIERCTDCHVHYREDHVPHKLYSKKKIDGAKIDNGVLKVIHRKCPWSHIFY